MSGGITAVHASAGRIALHTAEDSATANGKSFPCERSGILLIHAQAASSWDGTLNFEAQLDGTNWVSIQGVRMSDGGVVIADSGATLSEMYRFDVSGALFFRARVSGQSTGDITVKGRAMPL